MPADEAGSKPPMPLDVFVVPGSHFDLGWVLNPDGCLALGDHIIRAALDIMDTRPEYRFTIEYVLFVRHFLETFPAYRETVRRRLREGRLAIGATTTGAMEQVFDGETLVRQLVHGIRWLRANLDYTPRGAQHTDLPGHTIQMPQILARCGLRFIAYSRYRPPCPVHWWESPDGSRVLACNHVHHYNWGRVLAEAGGAERLAEYLAGPFRELWPAREVLMPDEFDLDWPDPHVGDAIERWNEARGDVARMRVATVNEFFAALHRDGLPTYRGESPYGFYSIPAASPQIYQQGRLAEHAIAAAERWAAVRSLESLGTIDAARLDTAWEDLFWPHDHNINGQDGDINDAVRLHRATRARFAAEAVLREVETSYLIHVRARRELGQPVLVFNALSWRRSGVVETYMDLPGPSVDGVEVVDADGRTVPTQVLRVERADDDRVDYQLDDPDQAQFRAHLAVFARDVPATGYATYFVRKAAGPIASHGAHAAAAVATAAPAAASVASAAPTCLESDHWRVELAGGVVRSLTCRRTGREIAAESAAGFATPVALEDLRGNLEDGYDPWDPREHPPNYTGREWAFEPDVAAAAIVEDGPVRTRLRIPGRLLGCLVEQIVELDRNRPDVTFRVVIDWAGYKNRQVRLRLPLALRTPRVTYETPYGRVVFGRDEMPDTYRGDGARWVQKWIDVSEPGFGVMIAAGCCAVHVDGATVAPLLVSTTYCRGDAFYWTFNRGRHEFAFTLRTHDGDWRAGRAYGIGWEQWSPLRAARAQPRVVGVPGRGALPERREYARCDHPAVVVTAFKAAYDGAGYVLRLFNVSGESVSATVEFGFDVTAAARCDLNEQADEPVPLEPRRLPLTLGPHEIASYRITLQRGPAPVHADA